MSVARARRVADAVLCEGCVLYPHRASAATNQPRWQFGVLAPRTRGEREGSEVWWMQTECLVVPEECPRVSGTVRFLQVQHRTIERALDRGGRAFAAVPSLAVGGRLWTTWEENLAREVHFSIDLGVCATGSGEQVVPFALAAYRDAEWIRDADPGVVGRAVRERWPIEGVVRVGAARVQARSPLVRLRVRIENQSAFGDPDVRRETALPSFLVGVHTVLEVSGGAFVSLAAPPDWAREAAAACVNVRTWPILVGEAGAPSVILSSPIILPDYPEVIPEGSRDASEAM